MNLQVEVSLSENLYQQVKQWADIHQQEIGEAIAAYLADAFKTEFPELSSEQLDPEIKPERDAFLQLHPELWKKYSGHYVAILGGKLVDHDPNKAALLKRIDTRYPGVFVLVRQVKREPEIVYQSRSIHWVQEGK